MKKITTSEMVFIYVWLLMLSILNIIVFGCIWYLSK